MIDICNTIVPIFAVILLGLAAKRKGFLPPLFLGPANRLVYYIAIPAMIFRAVSRSSFHQRFNPDILFLAVASMTLALACSWVWGKALKLRKQGLGTFIQSATHCNIGYIAFAVSYYYLGDEGLATTGLYAGFIMILQNFYSVTALTLSSGKAKSSLGQEGGRVIGQVLMNPTILSAGAGIVFSVFDISLPVVVSRTLDIIGGLGLPMALLIIGASLSFELMQPKLKAVISTTLIKLLLLPGVAYLLYRLAGYSGREILPILIMLCSPTATVAFVMAGEMGGDTDMAAAAISFCTICSPLTFLIWLNVQ
jgi:malate permease and related proteins